MQERNQLEIAYLAGYAAYNTGGSKSPQRNQAIKQLIKGRFLDTPKGEASTSSIFLQYYRGYEAAERVKKLRHDSNRASYQTNQK